MDTVWVSIIMLILILNIYDINRLKKRIENLESISHVERL